MRDYWLTKDENSCVSGKNFWAFSSVLLMERYATSLVNKSFSSFIIAAYSSLLIVCFKATFPCHWHSTLAYQVLTGLHQLWALPRLLAIGFATIGFLPTIGVGKRLLFIGQPGAWIGAFPTSSKPSVTPFWNWIRITVFLLVTVGP